MNSQYIDRTTVELSNVLLYELDCPTIYKRKRIIYVFFDVY